MKNLLKENLQVAEELGGHKMKLSKICLWKEPMERDILEHEEIDPTIFKCYRCLKCDGFDRDCKFYIPKGNVVKYDLEVRDGEWNSV